LLEDSQAVPALPSDTEKHENEEVRFVEVSGINIGHEI
jgi:hypothetical protein